MLGFPGRRGTLPGVENPSVQPADRHDLTGSSATRFLLLHIVAPLTFAASYTALTEMSFTFVNFLAAYLTVVLVVGSYTLPSVLIRRNGRLRGLLAASVVGAIVGALLGLLGTGVPPRGSQESTAFASWLLVGLCAPAFSWFAVRTFTVLSRLPRGVWTLVTRLARSQPATSRHPSSARTSRPAHASEPANGSSRRKPSDRRNPVRKKRPKPGRKKR